MTEPVQLKKHFLLSVFTDGGEHYMAPSYFLISMTAEAIEYYAGLKGVALELKERLKHKHTPGSAFHYFTVWDHQAAFFGHPDVADEDQERLEKLLALAEDECAELNGDDAFFLDSLMEANEGFDEGGYQRMDYVYARIDEDGLSWSGCVKHCDYQVFTSRISWASLGLEGEPVKE